MIIGLLRHAIAEDPGEANDFSDDRRALTDDGRRKMQRAAEGIRALNLGFELILTSPLTRCVQTAQIVAHELDCPAQAVERLRPGLDAERLIDVLLDAPDANRVLICGHQPDMSEVAYDLLRGGNLAFKKGALAVVELSAPLRAGAGTLLAHYPPAALRRMAGSPESDDTVDERGLGVAVQADEQQQVAADPSGDDTPRESPEPPAIQD